MALADFGFGALEVTASDFTRDLTVALGRAPHQIDIMTYIKGVDSAAAWSRSVPGIVDAVPVQFIGKQDLLANKFGGRSPRRPG